MINESNVTIEVAKGILETQTATNFEIQNYVMPLITIISIFGTVIIACYNAKKNKEITKLTLDATTKNLIIQLNQVQIKDSIKRLSELVRTGNVTSIQVFMDSVEGIYIPASLKKAIKENENFNEPWDTTKANSISGLINEYISPPSTAHDGFEEKKSFLCRLFCRAFRLITKVVGAVKGFLCRLFCRDFRKH